MASLENTSVSSYIFIKYAINTICQLLASLLKFYASYMVPENRRFGIAVATKFP